MFAVEFPISAIHFQKHPGFPRDAFFNPLRKIPSFQAGDRKWSHLLFDAATPCTALKRCWFRLVHGLRSRFCFGEGALA